MRITANDAWSMERIDYANEEKWIEGMVEAWKETGGRALAARATFLVALSGGSTPAPFYRALAALADWPWEATQLFIGDERWVPSDHKDSNYKMIYEAFYPRNVRLHRWKTEINKPEQTAAQYEALLKRELGQPARLDLTMLGVGNDGHTASLFPGTEGLNETEHLAIANFVPQIPAQRLTFTYPLLNQSREIWFLTKGDSKKSWLDAMVAGPTEAFPAGRVSSQSGRTIIQHCIG